jgi:hypothetical protein
MTEDTAGSEGRLGAGLLPSDPEGLGPNATVLAGRHQVSARTDMAVDHNAWARSFVFPSLCRPKMQ